MKISLKLESMPTLCRSAFLPADTTITRRVAATIEVASSVVHRKEYVYFQYKINFKLLTWILNYALTHTPLNIRNTLTEREKRVNAPTTLPLINSSYANYPPSLASQDIPSLYHSPSLQLQEHISGAGGRDSIKYPCK